MAPFTLVSAAIACLGAAEGPGAPASRGTPSGLSADKVRAIVASVLNDAETRTSLAFDAVAGFDGQFFLADPASGFRLSVTGETQYRYMANFGADQGPGASDESESDSGFQIRNARLDFRGTTRDKRFSFRVLPAYSSSSDALTLLDSWVQADIGHLNVRVGQFVLPFTREFMVSPMEQLATDRSLTDAVFRLNRSQGIMAFRAWDRVRVFGAISDGQRALNTDFDSTDQAKLALTARAEGRILEGTWNQYNAAFSSPSDTPGILAGFAAHWQRDGETTAPSTFGSTTDLFETTADLTWKAPRWTALVAGVARTVDGVGNGDTTTDYGIVAHIGGLVTDHIELFARYTHIWPGSDRSGGTADIGTVEAGASWYLVPGSRVCKVTAQVLWMPEPQADSGSIVTAPNIAVGILPDVSGGQVGMMVQVQVVF